MSNKNIFEAPVVIVGAGVTGLVAAQFLAEAGVQVIVIERDDSLGGLARSVVYDDFVFDIGPHRFHTANKSVSAYLERMLAENMVLFPRRSEVFFEGNYYLWPLQPAQLYQLPASMAAKSGIDLLLNTFRTYTDDSFENYILRQYGPTLYKHFFEEYTEDFLGIKPSDTHPDWAKSGINRAIIDDKLEMQNLSQLIKSTLLQFNKSEIKFIYPAHGMGKFWIPVAQKIRDLGGRIILGKSASMEAKDGKVVAITAGEERFEPSMVIWTGPINKAAQDLGIGPFNLDYRALVLYNVMADCEVPQHYQWCYYGSRDIVFSRTSIPKYFDERTCPPGTTGICVEVTCQQGDERWKHGENLIDWVIEDLIRVRMLPDRKVVRDVRLERVPESYPIYHKHYPRDLAIAQTAFNGFENLIMAGRTGTFWYNNMDQCVEAVFTIVKRLLLDSGYGAVDEIEMAKGIKGR